MKKLGPLLIAAAVSMAVMLSACSPIPPHTKVYAAVADGEIVSWDANFVDAENAAVAADCESYDMVQLNWTGKPAHGGTWPFKLDSRPATKDVGLDFSVPFGLVDGELC